MYLVVYLFVGKPVLLVLIGAVAQALMLPFLALAALHFRHRETHPMLRPGVAWTSFLWLAFASMLALGAYQAGLALRLWS